MFDLLRKKLAFFKAIKLLQAGRWSEAEVEFRLLTKAYPDDSNAHHNLAIALLKMDRFEEAAAACLRAISLKPASLDRHVTFEIALLKLSRWEEAVVACDRALVLQSDDLATLENLGTALSKLGRWADAADAYRRSSEANPDQDGILLRLGTAYIQAKKWVEGAEVLRKAQLRDPDDSEVTSRLEIAIAEIDNVAVPVAALPPALVADGNEVALQFSKLERWEEATAAFQDGISHLQFLSVKPLLKLGRTEDAVEAFGEAVRLGSSRPSLPAESAPSVFEKKRKSFWPPANLQSSVLQTEAWLENLAKGPTAEAAHQGRAGRLLFVLDNDYGELTTLMYLMSGQALIGEVTLLLPDRLYANNADTLPGRTEKYESLDDIVKVVDRDKPDAVFLCSGYLLTVHRLLTLEELDGLVGLLDDRGCAVVTTDPFLGVLSKNDPRLIVSVEISDSVEGAERKELLQKKHEQDELLWSHFIRCVEVLGDAKHLYPSRCDTSGVVPEGSDLRNISFFNAALTTLPQAQSELSPRDPSARPHWLFILSRTDFEAQTMAEGRLGFMDIVAQRLVDGVAAGRRVVMIGPKDFIEALATRMPTTDHIDLLYFCPFNQLMSLLLTAEYAFYWNVLSHSILIRLFNKMPVIVFDRGHLIRNVKTLYERIVQWYYQGLEPALADHHGRLTLDSVARHAELYLRDADELCERYAKAPTPAQMIDAIGNSEAAHAS